MSMIDKRAEDEARIQAAKTEMLAVLGKHLGAGDPNFLFQRALGALLTEFNHERDGILQSNRVGWSLDQYVARSIGPHVERIVQLVDFLIEKGATPKSRYNFESNDRYAAVLANDRTQKLVAFHTQNLTYMVRLTAAKEVIDDVVRSAWHLDLRYCTPSRYSLDYKRVEFTSLTPAKIAEYFRYQDARDQGYLVSLRKNVDDKGFEAKNMGFGSLEFLQSILLDIHWHAEMAESELMKQSKEAIDGQSVATRDERTAQERQRG
jgi:hypothetical protein